MRNALALAAQQLGMNEVDQNAALSDYLATGGANLDPATTAWCAAFVNSTLKQSGGEGTGSNLARSFMDWGQGVDAPQEGDLAVFSRGDPDGMYGHVGFFKGFDDSGNILVLGGNQGKRGEVSVAPYSPDRLLGYRRAETGASEPYSAGNAFADQSSGYAPAAAQAPQAQPEAAQGDGRIRNALALMQAFQPRMSQLDPAAFQTQQTAPNSLALTPYRYG